MITLKEAICIAKEKLDEFDGCSEYTDAYCFFTKKNRNQADVVIYKATGKTSILELYEKEHEDHYLLKEIEIEPYRKQLRENVFYIVEKNEESITEFLDTVFWLHDFRLERAEYIPSKDMLEFEYGYDTEDFSIILRFADILDCKIAPAVDYESEWISEASVFVLPAGKENAKERFFFADYDGLKPEDIADTKNITLKCNWAIAGHLFWAYKNKQGIITEYPGDMKFGITNGYDYETGEHVTGVFDHKLKEFVGSWEQYLKTKY